MAERSSTADKISAENAARDWVVRLSSGDMAKVELRQFHDWLDADPLNRSAFERERAFWDELRAFAPEFDGRGRSESSGRMRSRRHMAAAAAIAAVVATVAIFAGLAAGPKADHQTGIGERATVQLPDGSVAHLNSASAIDVRYGAGMRLILLRRGEALFEVRPDKASTFRVAANGGVTDATGTVFATGIRDGRVTVTVAEGSVRVASPAPPDRPPGDTTDTIDVAANQQISYEPNATPRPVRVVRAAEVLAWRTGNIIFDNRSFAGAVKEVGSYVPEHIFIDEAARMARPVSGVFSIGHPYRALDAIAATQGFAVYRIPHVAILIR